MELKRDENYLYRKIFAVDKDIELRIKAAQIAAEIIGCNIKNNKFTLVAEEVYSFLSAGGSKCCGNCNCQHSLPPSQPMI